MTISVSAQQKISLDALAIKTRPVFELLAARPELADFVLIGGTAMALQMKHRLSEDLDFWLPDSQLKQSTIDRLMRDLVSLGHTCVFSTSPNDITKARIAGIDLNSVVQDWTINKVKVQFYCPDDVAHQYFRQYLRLESGQTNTVFTVMGLDGVFAMKSNLIHQRIRSRDLVDLWYFLKNGKTIADVLKVGQLANPRNSPEAAKAVLRGQVPLDNSDEGFQALEANVSLQAIYSDFSTAIDLLEVEQARLVAIANQRRLSP
jgi:hypothetical protein